MWYWQINGTIYILILQYAFLRWWIVKPFIRQYFLAGCSFTVIRIALLKAPVNTVINYCGERNEESLSARARCVTCNLLIAPWCYSYTHRRCNRPFEVALLASYRVSRREPFVWSYDGYTARTEERRAFHCRCVHEHSHVSSRGCCRGNNRARNRSPCCKSDLLHDCFGNPISTRTQRSIMAATKRFSFDTVRWVRRRVASRCTSIFS